MFSWKPQAMTPTAVLPFNIWWACVLFNSSLYLASDRAVKWYLFIPYTTGPSSGVLSTYSCAGDVQVCEAASPTGAGDRRWPGWDRNGSPRACPVPQHNQNNTEIQCTQVPGKMVCSITGFQSPPFLTPAYPKASFPQVSWVTNFLYMLNQNSQTTPSKVLYCSPSFYSWRENMHQCF